MGRLRNEVVNQEQRESQGPTDAEKDREIQSYINMYKPQFERDDEELIKERKITPRPDLTRGQQTVDKANNDKDVITNYRNEEDEEDNSLENLENKF